MGTRAEIIKDLAAVMNKHSIEQGSNTPDYVLAEFLYESLHAWNRAICSRDIADANPPHDKRIFNLEGACEQALDCLTGEQPEDMTHEEGVANTIERLREVLR